MSLKRKASPDLDDYLSALRVVCAPRLELSLNPVQTMSPLSISWLRNSFALANTLPMQVPGQIANADPLTPALVSALLAPKVALSQEVTFTPGALLGNPLTQALLTENVLAGCVSARSTSPPQGESTEVNKTKVSILTGKEPTSSSISTASASLSATNNEEKRAFSSKTWSKMFERLKLYQKKHNNCLVPRHHRDDPKLGNWVNYQRYNRNKGCLSEHRTKLLDSVGFAWSANETWDDMFERLVKYKEKNGDCLVRQDCKEDPKLGSWVMTQRRKKDTLSPSRLARLNSIGFVWSVHQALWDTMFETLVEFKARNGHCRVPWSYKDDPPLGRWVYEQEKNKARIPAERRVRLEAVGLFRSSEE